MKKIEIKQGGEKIFIPPGIYVNGYIINATMCKSNKSILQLKKVMVIQPNTATTPKEKEDGDT